MDLISQGPPFSRIQPALLRAGARDADASDGLVLEPGAASAPVVVYSLP